MEELYQYRVDLDGRLIPSNELSALTQQYYQQSSADEPRRIYQQFIKEVVEEQALIKDKYAKLPPTPQAVGSGWQVPQTRQGLPTQMPMTISQAPAMNSFSFGFKKK